MATVRLTAALRSENQTLFDACQIWPARAASVEQAVARILCSKARYAAVCCLLEISWPVLAAIHRMEGSLGWYLRGERRRERTAETGW